MECCLRKRAALRSQVTRILNECQDAMQRDLPKSEAAVLHARLKKVTKNLLTLDNKIETLVPDEDFEDECAQVLDYNDRILSCLTRLQQRIDGDSVPSAAPSTVINEVVSTEQTQRSKIKLPKLELIKFSGRSNEWQHFWELFEEVVDKNEDLSSIDKYNFLRVSVTGDAATAIAGHPPTAPCYNDAVQLLKKRFGNEELLIQEHFKKLIDLKPVRSSEDVRGLRRLHDTLAAHIRGLETLGRKLETFSSMLLPIAQRALPGDLLLDYSRKRVLETSNDGHYSRQTTHTEGVPETTTDSQKGTVTSFSRLLDFLRVEVESRENLAALRRMDGRRFKLEVLETDVICDHKIPAPPQSVAHQLGHLDCDIADLANSDAPEDIGLLIGSEYIWGLTTGRTRKLGESLRAVETVFGWSVQGPIEWTSQQNQCTETVTLRTSVVEDKTADVLSKFWTLESIGITDKEECKPGECAAMEVFEQTLTKVDGRYEVALPWKTEISLDDNKEITTKRLQQLTNRLLKSPELLEEYDAVIRQYIAHGIVERVEGEVDDGQNVYYMPHQAVIPRLCRYILNTLDERPATAYLWTDSTIALHWIFGNADRWQQFVRNRVVEIQTLTGDLSWRHCPGKDNPADLLTRGLPVAHLTTTKLWTESVRAGFPALTQPLHRLEIATFDAPDRFSGAPWKAWPCYSTSTEPLSYESTKDLPPSPRPLGTVAPQR
ncbi:uncharacterized protein LOC144139709 [Haemaphysalis longicornis]